MEIALVGMPNCGKSTLFNRLTGKHARTGNRAGVTVSTLRGKLRGSRNIFLTDLPGVYSPGSAGKDEAVTWQALAGNPPEWVVFVADGTQLARAGELLATVRTRHRTVLAVNMCDELEKAGTPLDSKKLQSVLDLPVFPVSAKNGQGIPALAEFLIKAEAGSVCHPPFAGGSGRSPGSSGNSAKGAAGSTAPAGASGHGKNPVQEERQASDIPPAAVKIPGDGVRFAPSGNDFRNGSAGDDRRAGCASHNTPAGRTMRSAPAGCASHNMPAGCASHNMPAGCASHNTPAGCASRNMPAGCASHNTPAGHTMCSAPAGCAGCTRYGRSAGGTTCIPDAFRESAQREGALPPPPPRGRLQDMADRLFLTPWTGIPALFLFLTGVLFLSFGAPGAFLAEHFSALLALPLRLLFSKISGGLPPFFASFLLDGVLAGTVAVLDFAPRLFLLFLFLAVLEDSGYLARAGALAAPVLRFFGLSGDAAVPLLLGIGCSVPAVLATRHIRDGGTRRLTVLLVPFIPCSARLPVIAVISALFFASPFAARVVPVLGGVILFLLFAFFLSRWTRPAPFAGELPRYRMPSARNVLAVSLRRTGHFLRRAGLAIPVAAAVLWLLSHLTLHGTPTAVAESSLLAVVSGKIAPFFAPLGFGCWQAVAALFSGIAAKETVLSALAVFAGGNLSALSGMLSPRSALSFLCFFATYFPCVATQSAIRREGGWRALGACLALSFAGAYALAFVVYHL